VVSRNTTLSVISDLGVEVGVLDPGPGLGGDFGLDFDRD